MRKGRRGAAPGPSGLTSDHLFPVLEREAELLAQVGSLLAVGNVAEEIIDAYRLGRLTALIKPDGGVRGIVVGDIVRRQVARTMAKQVAKKVEAATAPFQCALSTKAGCQCVAHILQSITDLDPETTIISIDGVGAYDLISRNAMQEGLLRMEDGDQLVRFLVEAQARLRENEIVFAYLDDVYAACKPLSVASVHTADEEELFIHANIHVHHGKTQVWNRGGVMPEGNEELTRAARRVKPDAVVWKGDRELPHAQQGLKLLGVPIGQPEHVRDLLEKKSRERETLFNRIPKINDPQAAWLLPPLVVCFHESEFLAEGGEARAHGGLRSSS